jgi:hypothetical protein
MGFPLLLCLEDAEALGFFAVAALATAGRLAVAAMHAPPISISRRDMPTLVVEV